VTLGDLTVTHLGHLISWTDGGATYTGVLHKVQHEARQWASPTRTATTSVAIQSGVWRHAATYPSATEVAVSSAHAPSLVTAVPTGQGT
jgi:hypothetical protein